MRVYAMVRITMGQMYVTEKKIHSYLERGIATVPEREREKHLLSVTFDIGHFTIGIQIGKRSNGRQRHEHRHDPYNTDNQNRLFVRQLRTHRMDNGEISRRTREEQSNACGGHVFTPTGQG